jgi:hypothetical protein
MPKTVTGKFGSADAARNAHEDLIDSGFPSEKVYLDREAGEVKVIATADTEREVREILGRHQPADISEHEM